MAKQKTKAETKQSQPKTQAEQLKPGQYILFSRENYLILFAGLALLGIGFLLMSGGQQPPDQFDPNVIYSFRRITLSTIFVLVGFGVIMVSIFWKRKNAAIK